MARLILRTAAFALMMLAAQALSISTSFSAPAVGDWGFDSAGADFSTNPGDDFFRYANGSWYDRAEIPADRTSNGVFSALSIVAEARVRQILERGEEGVDPSVRQDASKIGALYAAFMNEAGAEALDMKPIENFLQAIRNVSSREQLVDLMGTGSRSFYGSIFNLRIRPDDKAPDRYSVSIGQGGLGLNRDYYVMPQLAEKKAAYRAYVAQMLALIGWGVPEQSADAVLVFESEIAEVSWTNVQRRNPDKTYNPMSVGALAETAPFPWRQFLSNADLGNVDRVVLIENTAIPTIADIYARTSLDTLKAWEAFHLSDSAAPYLSKRFSEASFAFHGRTMGGVARQQERWKRAVNTVNGVMGQAVGRVYVARYFPPSAKAQIDDLVARMRAAMRGRIERVTWMSAQTKDKALEKLSRLNVKIAYPDKWRDYSLLEVSPDDLVGDVQASRRFAWLRQVRRLNSPVDRDEWSMNPQTVNAYYNPNLNEMVFPAGILQPPFFDPEADPAANFAAIGAVIGHEMTHGFDDEGRKFDGAGILSTWWSEEDEREFTARAAVLGRQFDSYEPFPGVHVKGDLTMGENIADLGGALIALDAYHASLDGKRAPVIDGLTGEQRFFLSYAQTWREKSTEASIRQRVVANPHAPARYRVNGIVRNMDAWYDAFGVKASDQLYLAPESRARIW